MKLAIATFMVVGYVFTSAEIGAFTLLADEFSLSVFWEKLVINSVAAALFAIFLYFTLPKILQRDEVHAARTAATFEKTVDRIAVAIETMSKNHSDATHGLVVDNGELRRLFREEAALQRQHDFATNESAMAALKRLSDQLSKHDDAIEKALGELTRLHCVDEARQRRRPDA